MKICVDVELGLTNLGQASTKSTYELSKFAI
jgi:hypothetical protein